MSAGDTRAWRAKKGLKTLSFTRRTGSTKFHILEYETPAEPNLPTSEKTEDRKTTVQRCAGGWHSGEIWIERE